MTENSEKKLYRFPKVGWFGGICAGIAYKLKTQTWIIRVIWTLLIFGCSIGFWAYVLCWIFMPEADTPEDYKQICEQQ